MPNLSELTDYEMPTPEPIPASIPRVYIGSPGIEDRKEEKGIVQKVTDKLLGLNGEERYQLWPEKVVREGLSAAGDVFSGQTPQWGVDPVTGDVHTSPQMIEKAQAISALAGTGGLAGAEEGAVLNATPSLRPALKYKDKLYKGKPGQEHQDVIPDHLYSEFQDMAMKGEDISHYNFGFVNDKGHFLNREDALKYGIDSGLIDPQAGKFGALTSTLMADSSKPGTAIEAMAKADPFYSALEHNVSKIGQSKMTGDQWLGTLSNKPGVKPEELQWTGLGDFLKENAGKPVTKEQIEQHLASNKVELKEVSKGAEDLKIQPSKEHDGEWDVVDNKGNVRYTGTEKEHAEEYLNEEKQVGRNPTKYHSYQLPGGKNYRETLLTLPPTKNTLPQFKVINEHGHVESTWTDKAKAEAWAAKNNYQVREDAPVTLNGGYKSSHWDEPNILAHVRMNDRTMPAPEGLRLSLEIKNTGGDKPFKIFVKGETEPKASYKTEAEAQAAADKAPAFAKKELKSLHLEEIQSDWHQQGRDKGYKNPEKAAKAKAIMEEMAAIEKEKGGLSGGMKDARWKELDKELDKHQNDDLGVPDAPFKKTWHELALKRMIREAAEKGYDRLSWTPGEAQAARYDLSKSIDKVTYDKHGTIAAYDKNSGARVIEKQASEKELADIVGKEAAEKLIKQKPDEYGNRKLENVDLRIGGEGMKGFYDSIIPKAIEKLGKEHGVKVKQGEASTGLPKSNGTNQYGMIKDGNNYYVTDINNNHIGPAYSSRQEANNAMVMMMKGGGEKGQPVHYIDIPQSLRDTAIGKGFPLFSSTHIFTPVAHDPFNEKKK